MEIEQVIQESQEAVRMEDACLDFGGGAGVFDLNLSLPKGSITGIFGPSGCGKTTAIKMITGLLQPDEIANAFITYLNAEFDRLCIEDPKPVWVLPDEVLPVGSLDFIP